MEQHSNEPVSAPGGLSRRRFVGLSLGFSFFVTALGVLIPIIGYLWPPARTAGAAGRVLAGTTTELPVGKGKTVNVAGKPALVINTPQGLRAFSAVCTHLGCIVKWDETKGYIWCPCHDGRFNPVTGAVISGPPPAPLQALPVQQEGDKIYVGGAT